MASPRVTFPARAPMRPTRLSSLLLLLLGTVAGVSVSYLYFTSQRESVPSVEISRSVSDVFAAKEGKPSPNPEPVRTELAPPQATSRPTEPEAQPKPVDPSPASAPLPQPKDAEIQLEALLPRDALAAALVDSGMAVEFPAQAPANANAAKTVVDAVYPALKDDLHLFTLAQERLKLSGLSDTERLPFKSQVVTGSLLYSILQDVPTLLREKKITATAKLNTKGGPGVFFTHNVDSDVMTVTMFGSSATLILQLPRSSVPAPLWDEMKLSAPLRTSPKERKR